MFSSLFFACFYASLVLHSLCIPYYHAHPQVLHTQILLVFRHYYVISVNWCPVNMYLAQLPFNFFSKKFLVSSQGVKVN